MSEGEALATLVVKQAERGSRFAAVKRGLRRLEAKGDVMEGMEKDMVES